MHWQRVALLLLFASALLLAISSADRVPSELFSIINERLTDERSREFFQGICNASLPVNDHLYQMIGWCRRLNLPSQACFTHGSVACLFKKYIDIVRGIGAADGPMTAAELEKRQFVFRDNLMIVSREIDARLATAAASAAPGEARFGITKFMHLSPAEFHDRYLTSLKVNATTQDFALRYSNYNPPLPRRRRASDASVEAFWTARPSRVDWRDSGVVTGVKNQGSCGACWAFAVTEVAESEFAALGRGPLTELSVQQVTDCTKCPVCAGCHGGDICQTAGFYSGPSDRIVEEQYYQYIGKDGTCRKVTAGYQVQTAGVKCESFVNREDFLLDHLWQSGTAAVAVDAHMWQYYVDGTILHNCAGELNHAVQLVGYNVASGPVPFYLVRNSWGADWGMGGYLQIAQGSNVCGLAQSVVTFTVAQLF